ncbi:MAG: FliM/FliN family flagellar motor switch protein [Actinomycetota bacterium]
MSADTAVRDALSEAAAAAGLRIDPTFDDSTLSSVDGPFITMNIPTDDGDGVAAVVALRDGPDTDEDLLKALADATTAAAVGGPEPVEADPVPSGAEIEACFATPTAVIALTDGDDVQALVVQAVDRRDGDGAETAAPDDDTAAATDAPAPAEPPASRSLAATGTVAVGGPLDKLVNVELGVSVELGRTQATLADVLDYDVGSVIELDRAAGSPVDVRVNGMLLAHAEVVLIDDEYAVRITAVFDPQAGG